MLQPLIQSLVQEFSVSQLSELLKRTLEDKFNSVRVRGEISGLKIATSGHVYLNLKDTSAVLNAVCWAGVFSRLPFKPEEGMEIICMGKISAYAGRSTYQLIIERMESAGIGALLAMLAKRRKALETEGLFAPERKRPLPFIPKIIGVITSPTGAVIRDILHRISERFPVHVIVWPVLVQGNGAAEQIARAIEGFNTMPSNLPKPELLIVARGGGSIEDLWAFNEEIVVRAAANSKIPLISAVGHETDTTLVDDASDRRVPTPTAAAEIAVPVKADLQDMLQHYDERLKGAVNNKLKSVEANIHKLNAGLLGFSSRIEVFHNRISEIGITSAFAIEKYLDIRRQKLELLATRFSLKLFLYDCEKKNIKLKSLAQSLDIYLRNLIKNTESRLDNFARLLESFNYKKVLERGYSVVWSDDDKPITSAKQLETNAGVIIEFADGKVSCKILSDEPTSQMLK